MWATILAALIAATADREPLVLHVIARGNTAQSHLSDLLSAAAEVLEPQTSLRVISPESAGADLTRLAACPEEERLGCWALAVRGADAAGNEHDSGGAPRFLLVLTIAGGSGSKEGLSAVLIDTERALQLVRRADRRDPTWKERVENAIFEEATKPQPGFAIVSDRAAVRSYFATLFERDLRPTFEQAGVWGPPRIVLALPPAIPEKRDDLARVSSLWGGAAIASAGLVIAAFAAAKSPSAVHVAPCFEAGCTQEQSRGFASFCELGGNPPESCGGVQAAPLGFGLIAGGVTIGASTFFTQEGDLPWIGWIAGTALGFGTYALAAVLGR